MSADFHTHDPDASGRALISAPGPLPGRIVSLELHPWSVGTDFPGVPDDFAGRLAQCAALGEVGFDPLCGDAKRQLEILPELLKLAENSNKPVVLHLVRPTEAVFDILERHELRFLVHGFRGKAEKLARYLERGYFVSLGEKALTDPGVAEFLKRRGLARIGFETDAADADIKSVLDRAAKMWEMPDLERAADAAFDEFLWGKTR